MSSVQTIILNYVALMALSTFISWVTFLASRTKLSKLAMWFWIANIISFLIQGAAGNDPLFAGLAALSSVPVSIILIYMLEEVFSIRLDRGKYLIFASICLMESLVAFLMNGPFWLFSSGLVFLGAAPVTFAIIRVIRSGRKLSSTEWLFLLSIFVIVAHFYDYPFFRLDERFQLIGFIIAFWNLFLCSITIPSLVVEQIRNSYTEKLEKDIAAASIELRKKNLELEVSEREKTSLLRIVCHDMANSLTIGDYSIKYLVKGLIGPEKNDIAKLNRDKVILHLRKINFSIGNLIGMVMNIRTLLVTNNQKQHIMMSPVQLNDVLEQAILLNMMSAESKGVSLVKADLANSMNIITNSILLVNCVLSNILSNAIKFSKTGDSVFIDAKIDSVGNRVVLTISDSGPGIDSNTLNQIMSDTPVRSTLGTAGETGTGFGLLNVRAVCELISASIDLESTKASDVSLAKSGTKFTLGFQVAPQN